jgi:hypothetical protein
VKGLSIKSGCSLVAAGAILVGVAPSPGATNRIPYRWKNCTIVNKRFPHGVGRFGAHDRTKSGADPVRNFRRNNRLYREAMRYNRGLDRDNDKIACEKH